MSIYYPRSQMNLPLTKVHENENNWHDWMRQMNEPVWINEWNCRWSVTVVNDNSMT